ncbi:hypothetical protein [Niallia nealsonii]|uniref:DUF4359 domain-containing protein n=1 Tax=Niallia nealsonii TaxID=115979 RepID=A0A2N0YYM5_9BACI|nr:hypothetical protein [Niallia nealsonii]PKG22366.1 hypothetical protein CWS01_17250 [Niallia nealsonii]
MKKRYVLFAFLCLFLIMSAITNPSDKDEYADWVGNQIKQEKGPLLGMLGGSLIKLGTSKKDFVLFTIYETKFDKNEKKPLIALGIFNNFIWLEEGE